MALGDCEISLFGGPFVVLPTTPTSDLVVQDAEVAVEADNLDLEFTASNLGSMFLVF